MFNDFCFKNKQFKRENVQYFHKLSFGILSFLAEDMCGEFLWPNLKLEKESSDPGKEDCCPKFVCETKGKWNRVANLKEN